MHLFKHAGEVPSKLAKVIQAEEMKCAVNFTKDFVKPAGYSVLAEASADPVARNGRRILANSQRRASRQNPDVRRCELIRSLKHAVPSVAEIDAALVKLADDSLISYCEGATSFQVQPIVFDSAYQLPDLISDPRRK
jgi:hypothetical protein